MTAYWCFPDAKEESTYFCDNGAKLGPNDGLIKRFHTTKDLTELIVVDFERKLSEWGRAERAVTKPFMGYALVKLKSIPLML